MRQFFTGVKRITVGNIKGKQGIGVSCIEQFDRYRRVVGR